ncbi:MAG: glycogen/starch/alpha-glucan phosphorylase, partial [Candidatus Omnitrophota bacterium]|nr:glycogen/starch/alpha-glucan phosphorylase [Candidatus Omnitrophota bacterium]
MIKADRMAAPSINRIHASDSVANVVREASITIGRDKLDEILGASYPKMTEREFSEYAANLGVNPELTEAINKARAETSKLAEELRKLTDRISRSKNVRLFAIVALIAALAAAKFAQVSLGLPSSPLLDSALMGLVVFATSYFAPRGEVGPEIAPAQAGKPFNEEEARRELTNKIIKNLAAVHDPKFLPVYYKAQSILSSELPISTSAHNGLLADYNDYLEGSQAHKDNSARFNLGPNERLAYLSTEYGLTDDSGYNTYSGGLGVLSGDDLRGKNDRYSKNTCVAVGLAWKRGYFRQEIDNYGNQIEYYPDVPLDRYTETVKRPDGKDLVIGVPMPDNQTLYAKGRIVRMGRVELFLLDTDIDENGDRPERNLTFNLYAEDQDKARVWRFKQEYLLGIGGMRLLEAIGIKPVITHLNEGHAAFAAIEMIKCELEQRARAILKARGGPFGEGMDLRGMVRAIGEADAAGLGVNFKDAAKAVAVRVGFTTHTPIAAGNEEFSPDLFRAFFGKYCETYGLNLNDLWNIAVYPSKRYNGADMVNLSMLAMAMTEDISPGSGSITRNGVSALNGNVAQGLYDNKNIGHITNAVHRRFWQAKIMQKLLESKLSRFQEGGAIGRNKTLDDLTEEETDILLHSIGDNELIAAKREMKEDAAELLKNIYAAKRERSVRHLVQIQPDATEKMIKDILADEGIENISASAGVFTMVIAQRFANYKRPGLMLGIDDGKSVEGEDFNGQILDDLIKGAMERGLKLQVIFAGKAHPKDQWAKNIISKVHRARTLSAKPEWKDTIFFVPDYDIKTAKLLLQLADVWLSCSIRPLEASKTSPLKALDNGGVDVSTPDGAMLEDKSALIFGRSLEKDYEELHRLHGGEYLAKLREIQSKELPELKGILLGLMDEYKDEKAWAGRIRASLLSGMTYFNMPRFAREYEEKMYLGLAGRGREEDAKFAEIVKAQAQPAIAALNVKLLFMGAVVAGLAAAKGAQMCLGLPHSPLLDNLLVGSVTVFTMAVYRPKPNSSYGRKDMLTEFPLLLPEEAYRKYPNIVIFNDKGSTGRSIEAEAILANWSMLISQTDRKANIILSEPNEANLMVRDGRLFIKSQMVLSSTTKTLEARNFAKPVEVHYVYGFFRLPGNIVQHLKTASLPREADVNVRTSLEGEKITQLDIVRQLGIPMKAILGTFGMSDDEDMSIGISDDYRDKVIKMLEDMREKNILKIYVQPPNNTRKNLSTVLDISNKANIELAADVVCKLCEAASSLLAESYIKSIDIAAGKYKGCNNDVRAVVTKMPDGTYAVEPIRVFVSREKYASINGIEGVSGTIMEDVKPMPLNTFLAQCKLSKKQRIGIQRKIEERSRAICKAYEKSGYSFDIMAVDFIISDQSDQDGIPEAYFIESAVHFAGEPAWDRIKGVRKGSYRENLLNAAYERAGAYKRQIDSVKAKEVERPKPLPFQVEQSPAIQARMTPELVIAVHDILSSEEFYREFEKFGVTKKSVNKITIDDLAAADDTRALWGRDVLTLSLYTSEGARTFGVALYKRGYNLDRNITDPYRRIASRLVYSYRDLQLEQYDIELRKLGIGCNDIVEKAIEPVLESLFESYKIDGSPIGLLNNNHVRNLVVGAVSAYFKRRNIRPEDLEKVFAIVGFSETKAEYKESQYVSNSYLPAHILYMDAEDGIYFGYKVRLLSDYPTAQEVLMRRAYKDEDLSTRPDALVAISKEIVRKLLYYHNHDRLIPGVSKEKTRRYPFDITLRDFIVKKDGAESGKGIFSVELMTQGGYIRRARENEIVRHMNEVLGISYDIIFSTVKELDKEGTYSSPAFYGNILADESGETPLKQYVRRESIRASIAAIIKDMLGEDIRSMNAAEIFGRACDKVKAMGDKERRDRLAQLEPLMEKYRNELAGLSAYTPEQLYQGITPEKTVALATTEEVALQDPTFAVNIEHSNSLGVKNALVYG